MNKVFINEWRKFIHSMVIEKLLWYFLFFGCIIRRGIIMIYLICNAHIDPVWLWRWDEGASETLSTFRSAADLLEEYPELIFCHNESLLYEWIEEYDPWLFARIKTLVAAGRWQIIGGWFLQPDMNIPRGESIVRQILKGQQYFKKRFGKTTETANNFDSFGHAQGLVQVLVKCGYTQYLICRPGKDRYEFSSPDFTWRGYDGSEITVHRSDENYNSVLGKVKTEIEDWQKAHSEDTLFLWGVGNHGGGPSRKDLDGITELIRQGKAIKHASPHEYFDKLDRSKLPIVDRGLNHIMEGCYTSHIRVKQLHRCLENDLIMVETMASQAVLNHIAAYEKEGLADAWRDLLFAEFHDSLPGSAIQKVEEDTISVLSHGLEITSRLKARYFFALVSGQEKSIPDTVSLIAYNPHPFMVKGALECSFVLPHQIWEREFHIPVVYQNGKRLPSQTTKEEGNFNMDWCKRVVFAAEVPPTSMSRFDVQLEVIPSRPLPPKAVPGEDIIVKTAGVSDTTLIINAKTGLVDSYTLGGKEYLKKGAFSLDVFEDGFNSWNGFFTDRHPFTAPIGCFTLMSPERATLFAGVKGSFIEPVRMIEDGEVRTVVEALMEYGDSRVCKRYIVDKASGTLEVMLIVFFAESEKRLKMGVPTRLSGAEYIGQTMFGRERLDVCPGEHVSQYWSCISDGSSALSIANDGVYGSDYADGTARISLLRSAGYGASSFILGEPFHEPMYQPRMEQGERRYRFLISVGGAERLLRIDREAAILNMTPYILPFCPSGEGMKPLNLASIDRDNVALSCFKQCEEDESAYIVRIFESQGTACDFTLSVPVLNIQHIDTIKAFEIKTFRVDQNGIAPVSMLEL
jgi:alpha-mannosidase